MENNFQLNSAAISDIGLNEKRPQNEDSYLELVERGIFAVADGVGGAQAGDVASQMAMELLGEAFINFKDGGDAEEMMGLAIDRANSAIYQMSHDLPQLSSMATTLVALHVAGNIATIGHVGDSRMYRVDGNGSLFRETQDHSIVEEEVRAGRMTAEQAATHPSRNVISRALGAEPTVEIDMKTIMFEPNTAFLLCSDGITRHINDFEIRELLTMETSPGDICDRMKRICYERGAEDNLTAVVVKISADGARNYSEHEAVFLDLDEPTVATARPAPDSPDDTDDTDMEDTLDGENGEIPAETLEMPADMSDSFAGRDTEEITTDIPEETPATPVYDAEPPAPPSPPADDRPMFGRSESADAASGGGSGMVGKVLSGLIMLLLGAILGAVLYSFLIPKPTPDPTPPVLDTPKVDVNLTNFEELRREVDNDPAKYISATATTLPRDAEDYYLLGRAYLLTGDYVKARGAYVEAKNRAQEIKGANKKLVLNEIAMAMAILNNTFTQRALADDLSKNGLGSNSNTNTGINGNVNR
jgi:serine/threonine protein phosphatase PrpC